jgi:hypothetical protein
MQQDNRTTTPQDFVMDQIFADADGAHNEYLL